MPQTFALPQGFSTAPPSPAAPASGGGGYALPPGFTTSPPTGAAPQQAQPSDGMLATADAALSMTPILGTAYNVGKSAIGALNSGGQPGPGERRGNLAPVIRNEQTGAMRLAWPQLALDAASAFSLPGDVASGKAPLDPRVPYSQQDPATLDRAASLATMVGMGAPLPADAAGSAATRALVTADGKAIPKLVAGDLMRSGIAPQNVNAQIAAMGPGAVLADLSPVLQGRAAKLATLPEQAQTIVADTLGARQAGAGPRIKAQIGSIAGPEPVPSAVAAGIQAGKDIIGPYYDKVLNAANTPVRTQPIIDNLNGNVAMLRGPEQQALAKVRAMFNVDPAIAQATGQKITTDPRIVFSIRNSIDGVLKTETNPQVIGVLTAARQKIDAALGAAVPGIKSLDAYYQEQARQKEGFDFGRAALRHGEAPIHPDDLASAMQQTAMQSSNLGPMSRPSQFPTMIRQGMLSKMYEIVGNNVNDRLNLRKIITGEGKWNYQKIAAAFGQTKADQLLKLFQNEATMANTENLALNGSKTARMASGGMGMEANPNAAGFLKSALNLDFGDAALGLGSKITGGAFDAQRAARNATIADALMSGGGFRAGAVPSLPLPMALIGATAAGGANGLIDWHRKRMLGLN